MTLGGYVWRAVVALVLGFLGAPFLLALLVVFGIGFLVDLMPWIMSEVKRKEYEDTAHG